MRKFPPDWLFICTFIQQIFIKHLLSPGLGLGARESKINHTGSLPSETHTNLREHSTEMTALECTFPLEHRASMLVNLRFKPSRLLLTQTVWRLRQKLWDISRLCRLGNYHFAIEN